MDQNIIRRNGFWRVMRAKRIFTIVDLMTSPEISRFTVQNYLSCLLKSGHVALLQEPMERKAFTYPEAKYQLVQDVGIHPPRIDKHGQLKPPSPQQRMWMAMKALKQFEPRDVALTASVGTNIAAKYIKGLVRVGFVRPIANNGGQATCYLFQWQRDTGPNAPHVNKDGKVFDQNRNQFMPDMVRV